MVLTPFLPHAPYFSELVQELLKRDAPSNVPEIIDKLFSEIENVDKKAEDEIQEAEVEGQGLLDPKAGYLKTVCSYSQGGGKQYLLQFECSLAGADNELS